MNVLKLTLIITDLTQNLTHLNLIFKFEDAWTNSSVNQKNMNIYLNISYILRKMLMHYPFIYIVWKVLFSQFVIIFVQTQSFLQIVISANKFKNHLNMEQRVNYDHYYYHLDFYWNQQHGLKKIKTHTAITHQNWHPEYRKNRSG